MIGKPRLDFLSLCGFQATYVALPVVITIIIAGAATMSWWGMCSVEAADALKINTLPHKIEETFVVGKVKSVSPDYVDQELVSKTGIMSRHQNVQVEILEGT
ncbi:MAG: hypothetical protein HY711_08850, partial [Candidatus Melainabacteria bacterium]|nr:hypothetical protein [Candidatus Melainabacteria bacterium]